MKYKNYFELASIQGELQGISMGMKFKDFNIESARKALKELSKKIEYIRETETYEK